MTYLAWRLLRAILLLVGVSALCFLFTELAPGSFFDEMRLNPRISPETVSALRARYGLDQPLLVRYSRWMKSVAKGDLGYSIAYNLPVAPLLWTRAQKTLFLTTIAMVITWIVAVPLGVRAAASRDSWLDRIITLASSFLLSVPEIVIAVALLAIVVRWRLLPVGGMTSIGVEPLSQWQTFQDVARHAVLPISILVLASVAVVIRHVRSSVLEALDAPFVQSALGLGIKRNRLLFRHVLPVAANPSISLFGFSVASLLSGSLLVEILTGWPGLGPLLLEATLARDLYLVVGGIMLSALFMVAGNFLADVLQVALDPRIRAGEPDAS